MAKLKMVAGATYICPPVFGAERTITRGEVVDVPDDKKEALLAAVYRDGLNNEHHYFAEVADTEEKAAPAKRTRATAK